MLQSGFGGSESGKGGGDRGSQGLADGSFIRSGVEAGQLLTDGGFGLVQTALGGGKGVQVQNAGQIGVLKAGLFGLGLAQGCLQTGQVTAAALVGIGDLIAQLAGGSYVGFQPGQYRRLQQIGADMLGVGAAAPGVVVALVKMGPGENQGGPAGGAADQAGKPAL